MKHQYLVIIIIIIGRCHCSLDLLLNSILLEFKNLRIDLFPGDFSIELWWLLNWDVYSIILFFHFQFTFAFLFFYFYYVLLLFPLLFSPYLLYGLSFLLIISPPLVWTLYFLFLLDFNIYCLIHLIKIESGVEQSLWIREVVIYSGIKIYDQSGFWNNGFVVLWLQSDIS